jgi:hypothetical protein
MARRLLVLGVVTAALCLSGTASAAPPEGSLRLTLVPTNQEGLVGPNTFYFVDTVYQRGRWVGTSRALCRFSGNFESPRCRITVSLPGGRLFVFVRLTPDPQGSFKVTGGTGAYQGRTGVGIFRDAGADRTRIVIWLTSQRRPAS